MPGKSFTHTLQILFDDVNSSISLLNADPTNQFLRRVVIKTTFSAIEGTIWNYKQLLLLWFLQHPKHLEETIVNYSILRDKSADLKDNGDIYFRDKFIKLPENIVYTIKLVNQLCESSIVIDKTTEDWSSFKRSIQSRNKITHPKVTSDLIISDNEIEDIAITKEWFSKLAKSSIDVMAKKGVINVVD